MGDGKAKLNCTEARNIKRHKHGLHYRKLCKAYNFGLIITTEIARKRPRYGILSNTVVIFRHDVLRQKLTQLRRITVRFFKP